MSAAVENFRKQDVLDEADFEVESNNETAVLRGKIHTLLDTFGRQRLAKQETIDEYRKAADADKTIEGLEGFYQWISGKWQEAMSRLNGFHADISELAREGAAGESDRVFLVRELMLSGRHDFVGQINRIESVLQEKFERFRRDRKEYDELRRHKLVENTGFLKVDAQTKIQIPSEHDFLAMTVPERRSLLKKAKEALPESERYAEKAELEESGDLTKQYDELLRDARNNKKIIGKKTQDKFRDGFRRIDRSEKHEWIREFGQQMERYEKLWKSIRGQLKGRALAHMESKRDFIGYTELFVEFGRTRDEESARVVNDYTGRLEILFNCHPRVISLHTKNSFIRDIHSKDLSEQYQYAEKFEKQMERYFKLRADINEMPDKKSRAAIDFLYESDKHGYTEIRQRYLTLSVLTAVSAKPANDDGIDELSQIRRERVRRQAKKSVEILQTRDQKEKFVHRLDDMIRSEDSSRYDQSGYFDDIQRMRNERYRKKQTLPSQENEPAENGKTNITGRKPHDTAFESQSVASLRARHRSLESVQEDGIKTTSHYDDAFHMTRVDVGGSAKKAIELRIDSDRSMHEFLRVEDVRLADRDRVRLLAQEGGEADQMTLEEVRHLRNYIRKGLRTKD